MNENGPVEGQDVDGSTCCSALIERHKTSLKIIVFLFPVLVALGFVLIKLVWNDYKSFVREDGPVEYAQSITYFLAFILALLIAIDFFRAKRTLHGSMYSFLALGLFVIGGEEISWGQRLFDVDLPEYFEEHNVQKEITLHNLSAVESLFDHMYMLIGLYGSLVFVALPRRTRRDHGDAIKLFVPDRILALYFFPAFAFYFYWYYLREPMNDGFGVVWYHQEPAELLLALGFLLFVMINKYRQGVAVAGLRQGKPE